MLAFFKAPGSAGLDRGDAELAVLGGEVGGWFPDKVGDLALADQAQDRVAGLTSPRGERRVAARVWR